jgi:dihydroorotase-like cyclic amidohydrolase
MDLIVRNARLSDRGDDLFDIGIEKGRIVAIEKNSPLADFKYGKQTTVLDAPKVLRPYWRC